MGSLSLENVVVAQTKGPRAPAGGGAHVGSGASCTPRLVGGGAIDRRRVCGSRMAPTGASLCAPISIERPGEKARAQDADRRVDPGEPRVRKPLLVPARQRRCGFARACGKECRSRASCVRRRDRSRQAAPVAVVRGHDNPVELLPVEKVFEGVAVRAPAWDIRARFTGTT